MTRAAPRANAIPAERPGRLAELLRVQSHLGVVATRRTWAAPGPPQLDERAKRRAQVMRARLVWRAAGRPIPSRAEQPVRARAGAGPTTVTFPASSCTRRTPC